MSQQEKINYLEFPAADMEAAKRFFSAVFGWVFVDYGPDYASFQASEAGIDGGFFRSDLTVAVEKGSVLVVLYSRDLQQTEQRILENGGSIKTPTFSFPGGQRFHFCDPNGNEYAVWSDVTE